MNLYGFAGGDPVNFSDPYGLCPVTATDPTPCGLGGALIGGVAGAGLGVAVTAGCASVTFGLCAAGGPAIVGVSAGLGASLGGLIGTIFENSGGRTASGGYTDEHGNELGPSGKPKIHVVKHPTLKGAKDAAREEGDGAPVKHPSPTQGNGHFHPTKDGEKAPGSTHHEYPQE